MIIDINQNLFVVDSVAKTHRIESINLLEKTIHCTDNTDWEYSTCDITVVIGNYLE